MTLANSAGIAALARRAGAPDVRVVHLGTDLPGETIKRRETLVTVGHLVARKRHADVIRALWLLREKHPRLRYLVIGDGPERPALEQLARELEVDVEFAGQLEHEAALDAARRCALFVMPSVDEAFGVAYVEAMAGGVPAIGCRWASQGPRRSATGWCSSRPATSRRSPPRSTSCSTSRATCTSSATRRATPSRATSPGERCGAATVAAYQDALSA